MPAGSPDTAPQLRQLSGAVLAAGTAEDVVDAFLSAARALIGVDQVHLIEISQDASVGHVRVIAYEAGGRSEDAYTMVMDDRPSGTTTVVRSGEPLVILDARASDAIRSDVVEKYGMRSIVVAPLAWGGEVRWVAALVRTRVEPFAAEALDLVVVLANVAAAGLGMLDGRIERSSSAEHGAALARAAGVLNRSLDLDTVLRTLTREADRAVGGDVAGVYLGDGVTGGIATAGHNTPAEWEGYLMKPGEGVGGQVLKSGRSVITNAYQEDVRLPDTGIAAELQTAVAVPMRWDGELKGALSIGFSRMRRVTRSDLTLLEAFADLASVACRNAEAHRSVSRRDAVTGALEHGALEAAMAAALSGQTPPRGCVFVDLDGFHAVNAEQGHRRGDDVLRRVAAVVRRECGDGVPVGHFGGDQFAAAVTAEPAIVARRTLDALASELDLRASVGVAETRPGEDAGNLLDRALRAARVAKQAGGAQVAAG